MSRTSRWIILLFVWVWIAGCIPVYPSQSESSPLPQPTRARTKPAPVPLTENAGQLALANNTFGFDLLAQLRSEDATQNLFFSPLSLALALQMVYNGASAEIADEVAAVLHLPSPAMDVLNEANRVLQGNLRGAEEVELLIANSIWLRQGVELFDAFAEEMASGYDAEVAELDFNDSAAVEHINNWVDAQTNGEISEVLKEIPPDIALYLINAIYFKGDWQEQFDPRRTTEEPFTLLDGTEKMIPLMRQSNSFPYYQGPNFQLAALPYGDEGRIQMVVLLPDAETPLNILLAELDILTWQQWVDQLQPGQLSVALPRFSVEYTNEQMLDTLAALGLPIDGYTEIAGGVRKISQVIHKAIVKVDEEGTVAAAVTVVGATSAPPSFIVDRPFFFTIQDRETGAILFMGAIIDPEPLAD